MLVRYTGEITEAAEGGYTIKIEIGTPSMADAQEFGEILHKFIVHYIESRGGQLTASTVADGIERRPNKIIIHS